MGESPILAGDIGVDLTPLKILDMSDIIAGLGFAPVNHVDLGTYLNRRILNGVGNALRGRANPVKVMVLSSVKSSLKAKSPKVTCTTFPAAINDGCVCWAVTSLFGILIFSAIAVGNIIVIPRDINVVIPTLANLPIVPSSFPWLKTRIIIILAMGVEYKNYLYLIFLSV